MNFGNVAASFSASARPVAPFLEGFATVLSNEATKQLSSIPGQNAAMNLALAQSGLSELGATERQRLSLQAQKDVLNAQLADKALDRRSANRAAMLRMAGQVFGSSLPALTPGAASVDPFAAVTSMENLFSQLDQRRAARMSGSRGVATNALTKLFG
jgi:hypothetical protein